MRILLRLISATKTDPSRARRQALPNGLQYARMQALPSPIGSQLKRLKRNLPGPGKMQQIPSPFWLDTIREGVLNNPGNRVHVSCDASPRRRILRVGKLRGIARKRSTGIEIRRCECSSWRATKSPRPSLTVFEASTTLDVLNRSNCWHRGGEFFAETHVSTESAPSPQDTRFSRAHED
jgi:hypothetical protein